MPEKIASDMNTKSRILFVKFDIKSKDTIKEYPLDIIGLRYWSETYDWDISLMPKGQQLLFGRSIYGELIKALPLIW